MKCLITFLDYSMRELRRKVIRGTSLGDIEKQIQEIAAQDKRILCYERRFLGDGEGENATGTSRL